jgi:arylsulfatase A-like enzyme
MLVPRLPLPRVPVALAGLTLLAAGCGGGQEAPAPWRVRLWEAPGVLAAVAPRAPETLLVEEFSEPPADWHVVTDQRAVLTVAPDALRRTHGREGERGYLTLSGTGGSFYRVLAVEPDTTYAFRGTLRARGELATGATFHGATFWVGEFSRAGTPAELFANGGWVDKQHPLASAAGEEGWRERRLVFRTLPTTHALVVGCMLAVSEPVGPGEVDYDRLELARVDERELWEWEAARAVANRHRGEAPFPAGDWRARRSVASMFGYEERPGILLLPGERLVFTLRMPEGESDLRYALAPWPPAFRARAGRCVVSLEVPGLRSESFVDVGERLPASWGGDNSNGIHPHASRELTVTFGLEGPVPVVIAAPQLVGAAPAKRPPNVLLVSIDTLRADHVGAYGATNLATPHLDGLAARSTLFTDVTANAPYTLPGHASLFSGQFPSVHGVEDVGRVLASTRSPILARELAAHGYRTQAFTSAVFLTPKFGFAQGFDGFSIVDPFRHADSRFFDELAATNPGQGLGEDEREAGPTRVTQWLAQHADEPFFLFLHTYEVHDYDPPRAAEPCPVEGCGIAALDYREFLLKKKNAQPFPGTEKERAHITHLYDQALAHVDRGLGRILAALDELGIADETIVCVTSDHGEELFERGFLQHGKSLHREGLAIPWILHVPGEAPRKISRPAMQVDLLPTLFALLGLPADARAQGVDLLRDGPPRPVWSEVDDSFARQSSVREGGWKLVHAPRDAAVAFPAAVEWRLFDLVHDPGERDDLSGREPERLGTLRALHEHFTADLEARAAELGPMGDAAALDAATQELLEHLGYGGR